jgi:hypothetical protein
MAYLNGRWNTFIFVDAGPEGNAAILRGHQERATQERASRRTRRSSTLTVLQRRQKTTAASRSLSHSPLYKGVEFFHIYLYDAKFTI